MTNFNISSHSIRESPIGHQVIRILEAAIETVNPEKLVQRNLLRDGNLISIGNRTYDLESFGNIYIVGFGKASVPMTLGVIDILRDREYKAIALTKSSPLSKTTHVNHTKRKNFTVIEGNHPIPSYRNINAVQQITKLFSEITDNDLVIFLISGGGSALLTSPVDCVGLEDIRRLTRSLLSSGADISEINCLRKHLSIVKGGRLAELASPATMVSLIVSDVVGDHLDVISSGPTAPDPSTFADAYSILGKYQISQDQSESVINHLRQGIKGEILETPKNGDPIFKKVFNHVIANNEMAAFAAKRQAEEEGYGSTILSTCMQGEARDVGRILAEIARQLSRFQRPIQKPVCFIIGGETTVSLQGSGHGGRNIELALSTVDGLSNLENTMFVSLATDGEDGPTDAAGAVVTGNTLSRGLSLGLDHEEFLADNNSYNYFKPLGDLIHTGPTQTNVGDLNLLFTI